MQFRRIYAPPPAPFPFPHSYAVPELPSFGISPKFFVGCSNFIANSICSCYSCFWTIYLFFAMISLPEIL